MPPTTTPDTRERILDAAERVVSDCPHCFTMDRIASDAGVSRATVYRRFGDVEGLRAALEEERGADLEERRGTRRRILDAALAEFTAAGVHRATISAIAERAGVSPMTVYNHFRDKEGLVDGLLQESGPGSHRLHHPLEADTPEEKLAGLVSTALEIAETQRDIFRLVIAPDPMTQQAMQRIKKGDRGIHAVMATILDELDLPDDIDPEIAAKALKGMMFANAVFAPIVFGEEVEDRQHLADQITRLFLRAVRPD